MSHTTVRQSVCTDENIIRRAAARCQAEVLGVGEHETYGSSQRGLGVKLPGWNYPVVFDLTTGQASFDNYNGHWGNAAQLDKLTQLYAVELAKSKYEGRPGHRIVETLLDNDEIKIEVMVGATSPAAAGFSAGGFDVADSSR